MEQITSEMAENVCFGGPPWPEAKKPELNRSGDLEIPSQKPVVQKTRRKRFRRRTGRRRRKRHRKLIEEMNGDLLRGRELRINTQLRRISEVHDTKWPTIYIPDERMQIHSNQ